MSERGDYMEKETKSMYSNKVSVMLNSSEAVLTFLEIQPRYDEKDVIVGSDTTDKSTIFMSLEAFKGFLAAANQLMKQVEDGKKETTK